MIKNANLEEKVDHLRQRDLKITIKEVEAPQAKEKIHIDICTACKRENYCVLQRSSSTKGKSGRYILQCEEFLSFPPAPIKVPNTLLNPKAKLSSKLPAGQYKGLCCNCDLREDCTFPKPIGGVWHCAEYK